MIAAKLFQLKGWAARTTVETPVGGAVFIVLWVGVVVSGFWKLEGSAGAVVVQVESSVDLAA